MLDFFKKKRPHALSKKKIEKLAPDAAKHFGFEIHSLIDSTNNRAKELMREGERRDLVIIAEEQNGGRGRKDGRVFHSPRGGIYMTLLLHPNLLPADSQRLTAFVATAVAEAIEAHVDADIKIKWVNDLYLGGKKIAGILAESAIAPDGKFEYLAVGIGINLKKRDFPDDLKDIATSIEAECGICPSREQLIAEILVRLFPLTNGILPYRFMDKYRRRSLVLGKNLCVRGENCEFRATALEIDDDGSLIVLSEDKQTVKLNSGEVSIIL